MSDVNEEVPSPCIGVCVISESTSFCQGCYRSLEEIQGWWDMDVAQKKTVVEEANMREENMFGN